MALCLAHAAAGYVAYEALRPPGPHRPLLLAAAVGLANAPDLDFLPGLVLGEPSAFHRGVTHTVLAVLAMALVGARVGPWWSAVPPLGGWALFVAVAYGSHLVVDVLSVDTTPPRGAQVLWPLSDVHLYAPFSGLGDLPLDRSSREGFARSLVAPAAIGAWLRETLALVCAVLAVRVTRAWRTSRAAVAVDA